MWHGTCTAPKALAVATLTAASALATEADAGQTEDFHKKVEIADSEGNHLHAGRHKDAIVADPSEEHEVGHSAVQFNANMQEHAGQAGMRLRKTKAFRRMENAES